jgi:pilus assembly protein Flp/PilA
MADEIRSPPGSIGKARGGLGGLSDTISEFVKREDGPTAVEYAVMLALIVVVCITAIAALGTKADPFDPKPDEK